MLDYFLLPVFHSSRMQQVKSKKNKKTQEKKQKLLESRKNLADVRWVYVLAIVLGIGCNFKINYQCRVAN